MSLKLRLARAGTKKRPFYRIVVADARNPRDGRFIEKVGTYNPLLPRDAENRVTLDSERIQHWLSRGARPTDRVLRFLDAAGMMKRPERNNPIKGLPGKKAQERLAAESEAAAEPAAEAGAEEAPAAEAAAAAEQPAAEAAPEAEAKPADEAEPEAAAEPEVASEPEAEAEPEAEKAD